MALLQQKWHMIFEHYNLTSSNYCLKYKRFFTFDLHWFKIETSIIYILNYPSLVIDPIGGGRSFVKYGKLGYFSSFDMHFYKHSSHPYRTLILNLLSEASPSRHNLEWRVPSSRGGPASKIVPRRRGLVSNIVSRKDSPLES